jgi:hypothetical protein
MLAEQLTWERPAATAFEPMAAAWRRRTVPTVPSSRSDPAEIVLTLSHTELRLRRGRPEEIGSAAYWFDQASRVVADPSVLSMGNSVVEEVAACLLGGFGMQAEVAEAAFVEIRTAGLLDGGVPDEDAVEAVLRRPLVVAGRRAPVRYRFPSQRAARLAAALAYLSGVDVPADPVSFREVMLGCPGVGPKTAAWITRNRFGADVAVIDVHIRRIGVGLGLFDASWKLPRDYGRFEEAFLAFARAGGVPAAALDACMWWQMHAAGRFADLLVLPPGRRATPEREGSDVDQSSTPVEHDSPAGRGDARRQAQFRGAEVQREQRGAAVSPDE